MQREEVIRMFSMMYTYLRAALMSHAKSERGATAVEYGIMVALIAVVIITAVTAIGLALQGSFETVQDAVE